MDIQGNVNLLDAEIIGAAPLAGRGPGYEKDEIWVNLQSIEVAAGYEHLAIVFQEALNQAQFGKGRERHAEGGKGFHDQDICVEGRDLGLAYPVGQARKKCKEALRLDPDKAIEDLLGAINYLAAAVIVTKERKETT